MRLFDVPKQLSPYKEWERKNRIKVHFAPHMEEDPWCAVRSLVSCGEHVSVHGDRWAALGGTRDEAMAVIAAGQTSREG